MSTVTERVAAGAAFLDAREPGWIDRIHLAGLDLGNYHRCVLGQLHGTYGTGADHYELPDDVTVALGFTATGDTADSNFDWDKAELPLLTAEWAQVITERRATS